MKTLSIDPGITGSGWALWDGKRFLNAEVVKSNQKGWKEMGTSVALQLFRIGNEAKVEGVYCEFPAFFQSQGGQVTAKSGSLVKLAWFTGFLNALFATSFIPFNFIEVNQWKGQLPKAVVEKRIRKIITNPLSLKHVKTHAWDAIGIGLFVHGRMK